MNKLRFYKSMDKIGVVLFVLSLLGILYHYNMIPCIYFYFDKSPHSSIENLLYDIFIGIPTGIVVYFFTTYVPMKRKKIAIQPLIVKECNNLWIRLHVLIHNLARADYKEKSVSTKEILSGFKENCISYTEDIFYFSEEQICVFNQILELLDGMLPRILNYEPYLSTEQIEKITMVVNSSLFSYLKNCCSKENIHKPQSSVMVYHMVTEMVKVYDICHDLFKQLDLQTFNNKNGVYAKKSKSLVSLMLALVELIVMEVCLHLLVALQLKQSRHNQLVILSYSRLHREMKRHILIKSNNMACSPITC